LAQGEYGFCSDEAIREVAALIDLEPTEVVSVAGFYSLFYKGPSAACINEFATICLARCAADQFVDRVCQQLGVKAEETTPDGLFTVKRVMCLAACDRAPMMQVNLDYYENLDAAKFDQLIEELRRKAQSENGGA
jgi:NADH-quinone oxidoreductase subunit E